MRPVEGVIVMLALPLSLHPDNAGKNRSSSVTTNSRRTMKDLLECTSRSATEEPK
jgi:hypothetical protein